MKFSIVLSIQPASFSALAFKGELEKNIIKIKNYGYDGVELAVRNPDEIKLADLKAILHDNQLLVPAIGTGQAYGEEGLSLTHLSAQIREMAIERLKSHMKLARELEAVVILGLIRGKSDGKVSKEKAELWISDALHQLVQCESNVRLAFEPINRYETDIFNSMKDALTFLDKVKLEQVGLLLDTFHMNIEEPDIYESIKTAGERLFHFHVADSNRWYPGGGHLDFVKILETLDKINYDGFVSAEIMPLPDSDTSARKTIENLRRWYLAEIRSA